MSGLQKQVGARIKELREAKGITQESLADLCNLHRTYIGLIERGQRSLSLATVEVIAGSLGVPVVELFTGAGQPPPPRSRSKKKAALGMAEITAHLATIRQILMEAKLTDTQGYDALYRAQKR